MAVQLSKIVPFTANGKTQNPESDEIGNYE